MAGGWRGRSTQTPMSGIFGRPLERKGRVGVGRDARPGDDRQRSAGTGANRCQGRRHLPEAGRATARCRAVPAWRGAGGRSERRTTSAYQGPMGLERLAPARGAPSAAARQRRPSVHGAGADQDTRVVAAAASSTMAPLGGPDVDFQSRVAQLDLGEPDGPRGRQASKVRSWPRSRRAPWLEPRLSELTMEPGP
jgi:hypothetical protein